MRICTALVSVRSSSSGWPGTFTYSESFIVRAGWSDWDVEGLEVVPVVFDLGTLCHAESETREHPDELALDDGERVQGPGTRTTAGKGHVDRVRLEER